jgi:hypothetical protein
VPRKADPYEFRGDPRPPEDVQRVWRETYGYEQLSMFPLWGEDGGVRSDGLVKSPGAAPDGQDEQGGASARCREKDVDDQDAGEPAD